jgi:hypothetical protein
MSKGPQRHSDSHSPRWTDDWPGRVQTAALQFRRFGNGDPTALKLGSLVQKIGELLAALHHNCRLSAHERKLIARREPCSMMRTSRECWDLANAQCITVDK